MVLRRVRATPASGWLHAYTMARGEPHPLNAAFTLEPFAEDG
jgi:sarcosine oxidase subunit beta